MQTQAGWNEVTASWDAATDSKNGGFVMNYLARFSRGDVCITRVTSIPETADARVCTFTKLTPGVDYTFTVETLSLFGWGTSSETTEEITPNFVEVTETRRQGPCLSPLFVSRATWTGSVSGYPAGTTLTLVYRIGTGSWRRDTGARMRVDESGNFRYRRDFNVLCNRRNLSVRFEVGDPAVCAAVALPVVPCGTSEVSVIGSLRHGASLRSSRVVPPWVNTH